MARISVVSEERAQPIRNSADEAGKRLAYRNADGSSISLDTWELSDGEILQLGPMHSGAVLYVWQGEIQLGSKHAPTGSSALIEPGAVVVAVARAPGTKLVCVMSATTANANAAPDARVHLLSVDRVPRYVDDGGGVTVRGGLHANAEFGPCPVWLHENKLPGLPADPPASDSGVHSHTEDEVIFVTEGEMRLGNRAVGPGTALFIAADTMYGFTPGPEGLGFINFRACAPDKINFKNGMVIDEIAYWRDRVDPPEYVVIPGAA